MEKIFILQQPFQNNKEVIEVFTTQIKENGKMRVRIDPPDNVGTDYTHMHIYDKNEKPLDINGNIVNRKSQDAHIPWDKY